TWSQPRTEPCADVPSRAAGTVRCRGRRVRRRPRIAQAGAASSSVAVRRSNDSQTPRSCECRRAFAAERASDAIVAARRFCAYGPTGPFLWCLRACGWHYWPMDVNTQVNEELNFIPKGGFDQNLLRMNFQMLRSNALGANPEEPLDLRQTFDKAVAMVRQASPGFQPTVDSKLFQRSQG